MAGCRPAAPDGTHQIHVQHPLNHIRVLLYQGQIFGILACDPGSTAGNMDHNVHTAKVLGGPVNTGCDICTVRHICRIPPGDAALCGDGIYSTLYSFFVDIAYGNGDALLCQCTGAAASDVTAGTCDKCRFHGWPPKR